MSIAAENCDRHDAESMMISKKIKRKNAFKLFFKSKTWMMRGLPWVVIILFVIRNFDVKLGRFHESSDNLNKMKKHPSNIDLTAVGATTTTTASTTTATSAISASTPAGNCSGYDGMLHIRAGDHDAAGATVLFTYVINHIIYAERHNLIPWVHFDEYKNPYTYTHDYTQDDDDGATSRLLLLMTKFQKLDSGDEITRRHRGGGEIVFTQQHDGNLVLYEQLYNPKRRRALWQSGYTTLQENTTGFATELQEDCNLVTREKSNGKDVWASGSSLWLDHLSTLSDQAEEERNEPCLLAYNATGKGATTIQSRKNSHTKNSHMSSFVVSLWQDDLMRIPTTTQNMSTTATTTNDDSYFVANTINIELMSKQVVNPIPVTLRNTGSECMNNDRTGLLPIPGPPPSFFDRYHNNSNGETTNLTIAGHGIWRSYFHPVSTFDWDDLSCVSLPVVQLPDDMTISLHECDPNSVRGWIYDRLPHSMRPHEKGWDSNDMNDAPSMERQPTTIHEWLGGMRQKAATIVKNYYRPLPWLQSRIDNMLFESFGDAKDCLAMHIRHTDKGAGRQKIPTEAFLPYAEAYIRAGGKCIFLATDSDRTWSEISHLWPLTVVRRIVVQEGAFRSSTDRPTFVQKDPSRINTEILTDIYAMSKCGFFLHGFSAVSEAVIYLNPTLHDNSVNLDYVKYLAPSPEEFRRAVSDRLNQRRPSSEQSNTLKLCFNYTMVPHDYVLQNNSFLPDPNTSSCYSDDFKAKSLAFDVHKKQNPGSCVASNQLYMDGNVALGLGSMINSWIKPFMYALDNNLQFWSPGLGHFSSGKGKTLIYGTPCGVNSVSCWFEEVSGCKTRLGISSDIRQMDPRNDVVRKAYSFLQRGSDIDGYPPMIPPEYRQMGLFRYYSQLLAYLLRPNYDFRRHLETIKKNMNWDALEGPVLSLHIRHGDACVGSEPERKGRRCDDLSTYMEWVFPVAKRYGVQSIYLSTDSQEVIDNTSNYTEITWLYQKLDPSSRSVVEWDSIGELNLSTFALAQEALIDIFLLAEGDILVGKFTSNIDRIAYSLMTVRKNGLAPYLSLDSPWCFDWGVKSGRSMYGAFDC